MNIQPNIKELNKKNSWTLSDIWEALWTGIVVSKMFQALDYHLQCFQLKGGV